MKKIIALLLASLLLVSCGAPHLPPQVANAITSEGLRFGANEAGYKRIPWTIQKLPANAIDPIKKDLGGGHLVFLNQECIQISTQPDWAGNLIFICERSIKLMMYGPTNDPIIKGNLKGAIGILIHGDKSIEAFSYAGMDQSTKVDHKPILDKYDLWDTFVRPNLDNVSMLKYSYNVYIGRWFRPEGAH